MSKEAKALADAKERERKEKTLGAATPNELVAELWRRDVDEDWLANKFGIDIEPTSELSDHATEIIDIYEAVATGQTAKALALIYELARDDVKLSPPGLMARAA